MGTFRIKLIKLFVHSKTVKNIDKVYVECLGNAKVCKYELWYRLSSAWGKSVNHFGGDFARFYYVIEIVSVGIFRIYLRGFVKVSSYA